MAREPILIAKTIYGDTEKQAVNDVLNSGWLGNGPKTKEFENKLASYIGVKHAIFVNSGSSALLLALKSLNLPKGSEVITCAAGFPSTLNPIVHAGFIPVVVDCELDTMNIDPAKVYEAISPDTKAIIYAHAAGNPANIKELESFGLPTIEDACDAIGAEYNGRKIGSFGTLSCFSFYASHHITAGGGGGMVMTNDRDLATKIYSMRDWGKYYDSPDFYQTNHTDFNMDIDGIAYDRNYSYQTIGFNMKQIELGAAFGLAQFDRLEQFVLARNYRFILLNGFLRNIVQKYMIPIRSYDDAEPSWFFYPMILKESGIRDKFVKYLEKNNIHTRLFFAGNIVRQPALKSVSYKAVGGLTNADKLMKDALMIGVHPAITLEDTEYIVGKIREFFK